MKKKLRASDPREKDTSSKELNFCLEAMGSIRAFICWHASKTAAPYISELAEAAVGDALGTYFWQETIK